MDIEKAEMIEKKMKSLKELRNFNKVMFFLCENPKHLTIDFNNNDDCCSVPVIARERVLHVVCNEVMEMISEFEKEIERM